jgi:fermentation-respiration switch protein FrsA (DUF1100 family)
LKEAVLEWFTARKHQTMFRKILYTIVILYIMLIAALTLFQEKLIFLPSKLPANYEYQFAEPFDEINLEAADGAILNALHFKTENPKGVILYFHGNAGDLSRWGEITSYFTKFNWDVVVMDYRTYGKSTGKLSETALYEDAQLFYDFVSKSYEEGKIILYGRSLGTAFATKLAAENNPKMLILESPFYNLKSMAKKRFPIVPVNYLIKYEFKSNEYIKEVNCKTVFFHGTGDNVVPYSSGKKLYERASPDGGKQFVTIQGGGHNNLSDFRTYLSEIERLLK